jgi:formylglycine-generating enzyme required for sulfatase activity
MYRLFPVGILLPLTLLMLSGYASLLNGAQQPDLGATKLVAGMEFIWIPKGSFMMGSPELESGRMNSEKQHRVNLTKGYWLGATEVTQGQWEAVMGNDPSKFKLCGSNCPVEQVSWGDAQEFIKKLNGKGYGSFALPTEAQWEYAARAGTTTAYSFGNYPSQLGDYAWYGDNSGDKTHPVASKKTNPWGLYDMHGNVFEWTEDWYSSRPSGTTDPTGGSSGSHRVFRGGGWVSYAEYLRSAFRGRNSPGNRFDFVGFRLLLRAP